ncbi:hypothetical protein SARC_09705 [Sphaeroforma arctica JP610]|uniref:Ubiquitin-like domain-containing protein n=1 Tax=Sphaeroforma arctica JP610 TaxID=667725 RepID=A0A0L0FM64_9EUKA|nr:hypothetical protein SARC_09705 [Sphaeroforma arctica JP610]KNC77850.1 hypothetical protein SARC_09705 [Sphaeroforma arctica JP610]|eukprot:XP_014151752.1 hypothetical protein SARC_09705 [Sphaeroforma arctica JP610]
MIVTVHVPSLQQEFKLELGGDMELGILKLILEGDSGVEQEKMRVFRGDQQLADDSTTLNGYGLKHTDKLSVLIPGEIITTPTWFVRTQDNEDPATVFRHMQNDPYALAHLGQNAPVLADAVKANDLAKFTENFNQAIAAQQKRAADDKNMRARLAQNPNDTEAKAFMDNVARQKEVDANMHHAMEHYPEAFSQVHMLYILCKVNGHSVKAFVDSGAQMTIMNEACAKRCGIDRLLDTR